MAETKLFGPHVLAASAVDVAVKGVGPGAYALGRYVNSVFYVDYVGRSDGDLNGRLKQWVGHYTHFKYGFFPTSQAAFEKECRLFHDFGGPTKLDNKVHPARPQGTSWRCPCCLG